MPVALASGTATVVDWGFNITPPRDYAEWGQLVGAFARHCLDRYGLEEIAQWYFEVWNEPNIDFWAGSQGDYWKLYDVSAAHSRQSVRACGLAGRSPPGRLDLGDDLALFHVERAAGFHQYAYLPAG